MSRYTTASVVFYAFTVGFAIGGFALAATKHYSEGALMGGCGPLRRIGACLRVRIDQNFQHTQAGGEMSIEQAIAEINAGTQAIPSNPLANTGLSDAVTWHEVREWLAAVDSSGPIDRVSTLADDWRARGEATMNYSKTVEDEHISMNLLIEGATMVENARHIRNAIAGTEALDAASPSLAATAWEEGYEVGLTHDFEATTQPRNPYSGATK